MKIVSRITNGPLFGRYLLITNTVSSGLLMALGDVTIQKMEHIKSKKPSAKHDWARTGMSTFLLLLRWVGTHGCIHIVLLLEGTLQNKFHIEDTNTQVLIVIEY